MKRRLLVYFGVIGGLAVLNFGGPSGCGTSAKCGDGFVSGDEVCDGSALNGQTCESQGFSSEGTLKCAADCKSFDTSSCQKPGTLSGRSDISGDSDDSAFLIGDGLGNAYTTIHFKSTTLMAGGKSLGNVPPGPGVPRGAAGTVNADGTFAWLLGFQSNSTPFGDNGAS